MYPKIINVATKEGLVLIVDFENDITKKIKVLDMWDEEGFNMLKNEFFLKTVKVDAGGYGISWNDEIDMSEYELWVKGEVYNNH